MSILRQSMIALTIATLLLTLSRTATRAADAPTTKPAATIAQTPEAYTQGAMANAKRRMTAGKWMGGGFTWHASFPMHGFLDAYLATKDTAWLDAAVKYYDWNLGLRLPGPDGTLGWLGPSLTDAKTLGEHPIDDAIMIEPMVRFAELVLKDEPALTARYGERAQAYVAVAKKQMFEKWEQRGIWHEDGPYGVFTEWPWYFTEQESTKWHEPPADARSITLPLNMQVHWGITAARLARITGEAPWRAKALQLFNFFKSRLCLYQDHYSWNYWEPFGPWDIDPKKPQVFLHWVGTHGYRDYQAGEIALVVEAYDRGLTFDAQDMKRFVNTNLKVMWNGDVEKTEWNNSDAGVQKGAFGEIRRPSKPQGMFDRYAGTLWTDLVRFDATARQLYEKQLKPGTTQSAYYTNVIRSQEPSFTRHYADPATVFDVPFSSCCTLTMVTAIPSVIEKGRPAIVSCITRIPSDLKIEVYSADGQKRLADVQEAPKRPPGIFNMPWQPKDLPAGSYRIRWTLKDEYRDYPITVR